MKTDSMSEQLCHCNRPSTVISQAEEGSHDLAPSPSTGLARLYATPPVAEEEETPALEDIVLMIDHAEDEMTGIEDQDVLLPVPPPQTWVADLGPAVSLQARVCQILERVSDQRRPFSLVHLWSGALYDPRDPSKYLWRLVGTHLTVGVWVAAPYAQGYWEHGACHPDDCWEFVHGGSMGAGESSTLEGDGESGPDFSHFSEELELGGLGPSCPMGQQDGCWGAWQEELQQR